MKTAYFVKIDAQNNNNRYYKMYQNSPKSFLVEIGRVGIQPITRPYPLSSWDTVYQKKTGRRLYRPYSINANYQIRKI